ncbi:hypothetical protein MFIFM68171_06664 [Madurella fahalii]|uniref:Glucose-methanol-choline oxidoreductase N-terminal domain-containing protein n=1 Tax=Madurella fahalii TaxID=1157608 RepID=A0ABQ0GFK7_9PEZI
MGICKKLPEGLNEVDIVIAGGGTAACILAGRLAAAEPDLSVLVIEGGTNNFGVASVVHPALFTENLAPGSKTAIFYQGNKASQLADRAPVVPSGGILGGGSSINFMVYTRAQRSDFDSWKTPGWSTDELLPFLKRLETYHGPGEPQHHGYSGPVHISDGSFRCRESEDDFIEAAKAVGYPEIRDLQSLDANNGVERWLRTISPEGRRQDAAHTFLHPRLQDGKHPNLHVLVETKVLRVLFDGSKRACGVEFTPNPDYQAITALTRHPRQSVKARKLVVVSCGACGTPSVLERSGIGAKAVLERARVPVVEDLPGVGHDYQDHHLVVLPFKTSLKPHQTINSVASGRLTLDVMIAEDNKIRHWNSVDVGAKLRIPDHEVDALGPEFRAAWDRDFKDNPNRPIMLSGLISTYLGDPSSVPEGEHVTVANYTAYPYSRGHLHITGPELTDPLDFDVGFYTDAHDIDLKKQIWAYKKTREIMRRTRMYRGELAIGHPKFPAGSKAGCVDLDIEAAYPEGDIEDIPYSKEDDKAIEQFLREATNTTWHSLGTVKMAPRENKGVVDKDLNVYGVQALKVVDMSIAPENVAANTCNTAMVIGEKAADIVARELGIEVKY